MKKSEQTKSLDFYLSLPYTTVLRRDAAGDVVARIDELPGCIAHGKDEAEALANVAEMKRLWLQDCVEAGEAPPEPEVEQPLPSGKWVQRVPRSLHRKLAKTAKNEGVSLNQLVTSMLSERLGAREIERSIKRIIAECAPSPHLPLKHYWDSGMSFENSYAPLCSVFDDVSRRQNLGNLLPGSLQVKIENANETQEDFSFTHRR